MSSSVRIICRTALILLWFREVIYACGERNRVCEYSSRGGDAPPVLGSSIPSDTKAKRAARPDGKQSLNFSSPTRYFTHGVADGRMEAHKNGYIRRQIYW